MTMEKDLKTQEKELADDVANLKKKVRALPFHTMRAQPHTSISVKVS
jgi:hypothetical protein